MDYEKLMTKDLFERLLSNGEGFLTDYKKEQYLFNKIDFDNKGITDSKIKDEKKGEILKDVLAFANTERNFDAFILIGVEELNDGSKKLFDANHIDDAILHQFINDKTNIPVKFEYKSFSYDGKSIGIFHIYRQEGLIFLKNDFGKLRGNTIYVRDGSSTKTLSPDEINERIKRRDELKLLQPIFDIHASFGGINHGNVKDGVVIIKNFGGLIKDVKFFGLKDFYFLSQNKQTLASDETWNITFEVDTTKYQIPLVATYFPDQDTKPEGIAFKIEYKDKLNMKHCREFYYKQKEKSLVELIK